MNNFVKESKRKNGKAFYNYILFGNVAKKKIK